MSFAEGTTVPVERSRGEIEKLISKYGANEFSSGLQNERAGIQFCVQGRRVRFALVLPDQEWARDVVMKRKRSGYYRRESIPARGVASVSPPARAYRYPRTAVKDGIQSARSRVRHSMNPCSSTATPARGRRRRG